MLASTSISRRLFESVGHQLAKFHQTDTVQKNALTDINLHSIQNQLSNNKNMFHEHIPNLSKKILGKTPLINYSKFLSQFIPKSSFDKITDTAFAQIGNLAQSWASFDLSHDERFKGTLLDSERQALARSIGDQNRSLATLGGLSNLAGLTGILVDTLWLLTVCLRSIFQIAAIYDRPLTGQQGIAIAYEILGKVNLSKLQEKQTLLAGLGIFDAMTDQTLEQYKSTMTTEDSSSALGTLKKIEEFAEQFNIHLENINLGFLHKIIPLTAVGLGATYNNIIINDVIDIALTIFAPTPRLTQVTDA